MGVIQDAADPRLNRAMCFRFFSDVNLLPNQIITPLIDISQNETSQGDKAAATAATNTLFRNQKNT